MKKIISIIAAVIIVAAMAAVSVSASLALSSKELTVVYDEIPAEYKDATVYAFGEYYVDGETNARHGATTNAGVNFDYIYLKGDGKGDYVLKFNVTEKALYKFGFTLMGWSKGVTRATDVAIDDSEKVRLGFDYENDNQYRHQYVTGISAILEPGEHTVVLSLPSDFDDSTVKTPYFENVFFISEEIKEDSPKEDENTSGTTGGSTTGSTDGKTEDSPKTADPLTASLLICAVSGAGITVFKKRK